MNMIKAPQRLATASFLAFFLGVSFFLAASAAARPRIVRGTIEKMAGATLLLKQAKGPNVTVKLLPNAKVYGVKAAALPDIKKGDWIGVGAMPQPDGSQKAIEVTIFAPSQRGLGEGFRPWNRPGSTMTNGTAGTPVASVNGRVVMVKYAGGEQKIIVGPNAHIRQYVSATTAALKVGARVAIYRPKKGPDGTLQTARVNVGLGGMRP